MKIEKRLIKNIDILSILLVIEKKMKLLAMAILDLLKKKMKNQFRKIDIITIVTLREKLKFFMILKIEVIN
jgi:hypothetical protein